MQHMQAVDYSIKQKANNEKLTLIHIFKHMHFKSTFRKNGSK